MESEVLNERIEREAKRVAAAFGVELRIDAQLSGKDRSPIFKGNHPLGYKLLFEADAIIDVIWRCLVLERNGRYCSIWRSASGTSLEDWPWAFTCYDRFLLEPMARGLYRLGFTDAAIMEQLPPLSAHEKLELRLTLPREFWPKTWLDEEEH